MPPLQPAPHRTLLDCSDACTADRVPLRVEATMAWQLDVVAQEDFFPASRLGDIRRLATQALEDFVASRTLGALLCEPPGQNQALSQAMRAIARGWGLQVESVEIVRLGETEALHSLNESRFVSATRRCVSFQHQRRLDAVPAAPPAPQ